jgi:predicted deacylase
MRIPVCLFFSILTLVFSYTSFAQTVAIKPDTFIGPPVPSTTEGALLVVTKPKVIAPNVDLKEVSPIPDALPKESETADELTPEETSNKPDAPSNSDEVTPPLEPTLAVQPKQAKADPVKPKPKNTFELLGAEIPANTSTRLAWTPDVAITGLALPVPVLAINGKYPGDTLCLTAAIHGDELNGIEIVRRVVYDIDPEKLHGQVIGIPIVNLQGFQRGSRYLVDRRDLNRYFPGKKRGNLASRIAYSLFNEVITHCDVLIDLHTGSFRRTNLPQLRANMSNPDVVKFTEDFDDMVVVHSAGSPGMLRKAAEKIGIPSLTLEVGESLRLQNGQVESGVRSINSLMDRRKMYSRYFTWGDPQPIYYKSSWIRVEQGGILFSNTKLGDTVKQGQILGVVTDPITNEESKITSPNTGRIIGMAVNQVVMPGFAAYHVGVEASEEAISVNARNEDKNTDHMEDDTPE